MKKLLPAAIFFGLLSATGYSQLPSIHLEPYQKKEFKFDHQSKPFVLKDTNINNIQKWRDELIRRRITQMQGSFSHSTQNGKIIVLFPDNMPCFVPDNDKIAFMPNGRPSPVPPEPMPNGMYIPEKNALPK